MNSCMVAQASLLHCFFVRFQMLGLRHHCLARQLVHTPKQPPTPRKSTRNIQEVIVAAYTFVSMQVQLSLSLSLNLLTTLEE